MNSVEKAWNRFLSSKPLPNPGRRTILVVNPAPRRGATVAGPLAQARKTKTAPAPTKQEKKTMATKKQIAARKRFAAMARAGAFKKRKASNPKPKRKAPKRSASSVSRPRVTVSGSTFHLGKRSKYKGRIKHVNPSRRRVKRRHYRNPSRKLFGFLDTSMALSFVLGGAGFVGGDRKSVV